MHNYSEFVKLVENEQFALTIIKFLKSFLKDSNQVDLEVAIRSSKIAFLLGLENI
jgi:hypothetical protein